MIIIMYINKITCLSFCLKVLNSPSKCFVCFSMIIVNNLSCLCPLEAGRCVCSRRSSGDPEPGYVPLSDLRTAVQAAGLPVGVALLRQGLQLQQRAENPTVESR